MKYFHTYSALLIGALLLFSSPAIASAAISFDSAEAAPDVAGGTASVTWNHTMSSAANGVVFVGIDNLSNVDDIATTPPTCGGLTMTQLNKVHNTSATRWDYVYYLLGPSTGVISCTVTRVNTTSNLRVLAASYTGVSQSGMPDNSQGVIGSGSPISKSLTSNSANDWFIIYGEQNTTASGASTNVTSRTLDTHTSGIIGDSNAPQAQGSFSQTLTGNGSSAWGIIQFSIAPAPVPANHAGVFQWLMQFVNPTGAIYIN